jgi:Ser/Thr protein kinase RdoA (MazF antagonist)
MPAPVELAQAALVADPALAHLPRGADCFGLTHGDFELDNIAWESGEPTVYDFDDAALSWFAADIAFALRDLTGGTGLPEPEHRLGYEGFLAGYREVRPFGDEELLPLFSRRLAALAARRAAAALDGPEPASLRERVEGFIARQLEIAELGV